MLPLALLLAGLAGTAPRTAGASIDLRVEAVPELWFAVRGSEGSPGEGDPLGAAIAAARRLGALFATEEAWETVDRALLGAEGCDGFAACVEEPVRVPPAQRVADVGAGAVPKATRALAAALDEAGPEWVARAWPAARERLEAARAEVAATLDADRTALLFLTAGDWLRMQETDVALVLVSGMPAPGFAVFDAPARGGLAYVAVGPEAGGSDTVERVVRATLEVGLRRPVHPLPLTALLRSRLGAGRVHGEANGRALSLVVDLAAADWVRRFVDPEHRDLGERDGRYDAAGGLAELVRPVWSAYAEGTLSQEEFLHDVTGVIAGWHGAGGRFDGEDR